MALPNLNMEDINQRVIDRYRDNTYQRGLRPTLTIVDDPDIVRSTTAEEAGRQIAQSIRDSYSQGYGGPEPASITVPNSGAYRVGLDLDGEPEPNRMQRTAAGASHLMGMADTHLGQMNHPASESTAVQEFADAIRFGDNTTTATSESASQYTYTNNGGAISQIDAIARIGGDRFNNMPIGDYPNSNIQQDRFSDRFFNGLVSRNDPRILKYGTSVKIFDKEIEERIEVRVVHSFSVFDVMYYVVCPVSVIQGVGVNGSPEPDDMFVVKEIKH